MYLKRSKMPKSWPIPRKGRKYVVVASHARDTGIPLLMVLRNVLKIGKTRKEVRKFMLAGEVKVNNKVRKDEKFPIQIFDVISLEKLGKNYRLNILNKKFALEEVATSEADMKIVKISGKKSVDKGKTQMNLWDGQNFLVDNKFSVGDSVIVNTKEDKVAKILPLKEGAKVEIVRGKHGGEKGVVKSIELISNKKMYKIKLPDMEILLPLKTLLVVG